MVRRRRRARRDGLALGRSSRLGRFGLLQEPIFHLLEPKIFRRNQRLENELLAAPDALGRQNAGQALAFADQPVLEMADFENALPWHVWPFREFLELELEQLVVLGRYGRW